MGRLRRIHGMRGFLELPRFRPKPMRLKVGMILSKAPVVGHERFGIVNSGFAVTVNRYCHPRLKVDLCRLASRSRSTNRQGLLGLPECLFHGPDRMPDESIGNFSCQFTHPLP